MMTSKRLRERQAAMRARPRKPRAWEYVQEDEAEQFIVRMMTMFDAGYSDEFIANALSLDVYLVKILRDTQSSQTPAKTVENCN